MKQIWESCFLPLDSVYVHSHKNIFHPTHPILYIYSIYIVQYLLKEIIHLLVMFYLSYYKNIFLGHWESCCTPWCMGPCHLMAPISRDWSSKLQQGTTMSQSNQHVSLNLRNSASSFTTYQVIFAGLTAFIHLHVFSAASSLIRGMLTVNAEQRATILDICSHWWINDGYSQSCLEEAEYLASLTPVRLDLLLSLTRQDKKEHPPEDQDHSEVRNNK